MFARTLLAALAAGLFAGLLITPVQYARVVPLIVAAEAYEDGGAAPHDHAASLFVTPAVAREASAAHTHEEAAGEEASVPGSRLLGTVLANLVTGAGFALILAAVGLIAGVPITAANGAFWGLAGFCVISLAPALGLSPELPAMPAGELAARQAWWIATVLLSAGGVYALVLCRSAGVKAAGVFALLLPHLVGAPQPADLASPIPPTLAAEFAVASLATSAAFWLIIGLAAGFAFDRLQRTDVAPQTPARLA